ncbi:MAG: hypothetical protein AAFO82_01340 [Bacteroidota bacterium]
MKSTISHKLKKIIIWIIAVFIFFKICSLILGRLDMKYTIERKSGIQISFFFRVLDNDIFHMPNAFDSDYTWSYKLKVTKSDLESISTQIENSRFYNSTNSYNSSESIFDSLSVYKLKGYWQAKNDLYQFYPAKEEWSEKADIEINKETQTIKVYLVHL